MGAHKKIMQRLALLGSALSCAWLISYPGYEPAVALVSSLLALLGLKHLHSTGSEAPALHSIGLPSKTNAHLHLSALLKGAYMTDRPHIIKESMDAFPSVDPTDVAEILGLLYQADRPAVLSLLSARISPPPSSSEATKILNQLYISDRPSAAILLSQAHIVDLNKANVAGTTTSQ